MRLWLLPRTVAVGKLTPYGRRRWKNLHCYVHNLKGFSVPAAAAVAL